MKGFKFVEIYKCLKFNYIYKVYRKKQREKGHLKKLYCPFCKKNHSFVKVGK